MKHISWGSTLNSPNVPHIVDNQVLTGFLRVFKCLKGSRMESTVIVLNFNLSFWIRIESYGIKCRMHCKTWISSSISILQHKYLNILNSRYGAFELQIEMNSCFQRNWTNLCYIWTNMLVHEIFFLFELRFLLFNLKGASDMIILM